MNTNEIKQEILRASGINPLKCMRCGKCSATCPSYDSLDIPPHQFVYLVEKGEIDRLLACQTLWQCMGCLACVERCPRGVEPGLLVEALRQVAVRQQGGDRLLPEDVAALVDDQLPQQAVVSAFRRLRR